jgi:signal transduction histidine kinase
MRNEHDMESLRDFKNMLAHDLESPIRAANSLTELLLQEIKPHLTEDLQDLVNRIQGTLLEAYNRIDSIRTIAAFSSPGDDAVHH